MGAVVNMRPDLFSAVIMRVPFLDVLTTMLDDTIPLTFIEKDVWGDPHVSAAIATRPFHGFCHCHGTSDVTEQACKAVPTRAEVAHCPVKSGVAG